MQLGLPMGMNRRINFLVGESESGAVEPKVLCYVHKLQETWDVQRQIFYLNLNLWQRH